MIVFDTSTLVSAAIGRGSIPDRAIRHAIAARLVATSEPMMAELRDEVLSLLDTYGVFFAPTARVAECRDPKDDKVLELALAAAATAIVSSDADLLVLHPWRGRVRVLRPAEYLAEASGGRDPEPPNAA